jgi:hypothetical protein
MKTYQVGLKCVSYTMITVEAENEDQAETLAYEELARHGGSDADDHSWETDSIEEFTQDLRDTRKYEEEQYAKELENYDR